MNGHAFVAPPEAGARALVFPDGAVHRAIMLIPFPGPSSLPAPVARALGDGTLPEPLRAALRDATADDEEDRMLALDALQASLTLAAGLDETDGDAAAGDDDHVVTGPPGLRAFPALVALAALREGPERLALLAIAGGLEMVRLAGDLDIPEDLGDEWVAAHEEALRLCAGALATVAEPEVVRPLLCCLATLQGDIALASGIASFDDDDGEDDADDGSDEDDDG
jgi:hypothetical protein